MNQKPVENRVGSGGWMPPDAAVREIRRCFADVIADLEARAAEYRVDCLDVVDAALYAGFIRQLQQMVAALLAACNSRSDADVRQQGHSLAGMGGTVGFPEISVVGAELAVAARDGRWDRCRELTERLRQWTATLVPHAGPKRVLVIDDMEDVRRLIGCLLRLTGYTVREAGDGPSGLRAYREERADLVILDMFMPDMDGLETLRDLRRLDPDARVLAMSGGGGRNNLQVLQSAARIGADSLILKPFTNEQLQAAVAGLM
ncbi:MAG: response regulator [bacterium]